MGIEYIAQLDQDFDVRRAPELFKAIEAKLPYRTRSKTADELHLETKDSTRQGWHAWMIKVSPREVYVLFAMGHRWEEPPVIQFITQWMRDAGIACHLERE